MGYCFTAYAVRPTDWARALGSGDDALLRRVRARIDRAGYDDPEAVKAAAGRLFAGEFANAGPADEEEKGAALGAITEVLGTGLYLPHFWVSMPRPHSLIEYFAGELDKSDLRASAAFRAAFGGESFEPPGVRGEVECRYFAFRGYAPAARVPDLVDDLCGFDLGTPGFDQELVEGYRELLIWLGACEQASADFVCVG